MQSHLYIAAGLAWVLPAISANILFDTKIQGSVCYIKPQNKSRFEVLGSPSEVIGFQRAVNSCGNGTLIYIGTPGDITPLDVLFYAKDLQHLQNVVAVMGPVIVEYSSLSSLRGLENLRKVSALRVRSNARLENVSLPNLADIDMDLIIDCNSRLTDVMLPALTQASDVVIKANSRLSKINLRGFGYAQSFQILANPSLCISDPSSYDNPNPGLLLLSVRTASDLDKIQPCGCREGYYVRNNSCIICPVGSYCPGGVHARNHSCAPGKTSRQGSTKSIDCTCLPGLVTFAVAGYSQCLACNSGSSLEDGSQMCKCNVGFEPSGVGRVTGDCIPCGYLKRKDTPGDEFCHLDHVLMILVVSCSVLVMLPICFLFVRHVRMRRRRLVESALQRMRDSDKIETSLKAIHSLDFPMAIMKASTFLKLGRLIPHELARVNHSILFLDSGEDIIKFTTLRKIMFFSHQWLGFREPDPNNVHYDRMAQALISLTDQLGWSLSDVYVWVDYISIPQVNRYTQRGAINSLPIYASLASAFIAVVPSTLHRDLKSECNLPTYSKRTWCRLECASHYFHCGIGAMFISGDAAIERVKEEWLEEVLLIFGGECTCCRLRHEGMPLCDKELLVTPVLALYAQVLAQKDKTSASRHVYDVIERNKDQMFPKTFKAEFTPSAEQIRRQSLQKKTIPLLVGKSENLSPPPDDSLYAARAEERLLFGTVLEVFDKEAEHVVQEPDKTAPNQPCCTHGLLTQSQVPAFEAPNVEAVRSWVIQLETSFENSRSFPDRRIPVENRDSEAPDFCALACDADEQCGTFCDCVH